MNVTLQVLPYIQNESGLNWRSVEVQTLFGFGASHPILRRRAHSHHPHLVQSLVARVTTPKERKGDVISNADTGCVGTLSRRHF